MLGPDGGGLPPAPAGPCSAAQDLVGGLPAAANRPAIWLLQASSNRKRVESIAKRKLDSLIKESKIRDCEDLNAFTVSMLPPSGKLGHKAEGKRVRALWPGALSMRPVLPRACAYMRMAHSHTLGPARTHGHTPARMAGYPLLFCQKPASGCSDSHPGGPSDVAMTQGRELGPGPALLCGCSGAADSQSLSLEAQGKPQPVASTYPWAGEASSPRQLVAPCRRGLEQCLGARGRAPH